jgi:hypothetical protein
MIAQPKSSFGKALWCISATTSRRYNHEAAPGCTQPTGQTRQYWQNSLIEANGWDTIFDLYNDYIGSNLGKAINSQGLQNVAQGIVNDAFKNCHERCKCNQ